MKYFYLLFLTSVFFNNNAFAKSKVHTVDTVGVATILSKSEQSYATLKVYLDSGKVIKHFYEGASPRKTSLVFKTARSGADFNFEYYEPGKSNSLYTINRTNDVVKTWWGVTNKITTGKTLSLAIGTAAGVSSRTSIIVPRLLLPTELGKQKNVYFSFIPVSNLTETVNGVMCYKISGKQGHNDVVFWIAKKDFLIRKLVTDVKINRVNTMKKADSVMTLKFKLDSLAIRNKLDKETDQQKKAILVTKLDSLSKARNKHKRLMSIVDETERPESFSVRSTYEFHPYKQKVLNKNLFTFKPNREVPL